MAEEVLKEGQRAGEAGADNNTGFEGMETLARAIEMGKGYSFRGKSIHSVMF